MTDKVAVLQHVPFENEGNIKKWASQNNFHTHYFHLYEKAILPPLDDFDLIIIMGGPMSIHDEKDFSFLSKEKIRIQQAIHQKKKIIGICLGAQLLANCLGAKVYKGESKEIGWHLININLSQEELSPFRGLPETIKVFHWHGETFTLPSGANHLASSESCQNQAFIYKQHILGLQFHMETTPDLIKALTTHCAEEICPCGTIEDKDSMLSTTSSMYNDLNHYLFHVLDSFYFGLNSKE